MTVFKSAFPEKTIPNVSITEFMLSAMKKYPERVALKCAATGLTLTYEQVTKMIFAVSKNLRETYNFNKGDVLALYLPNTPMYPVFLQGAIATGAAVTTVNPLYTVTELKKQLLDSKATIIITISLFLDKAIEVANSGETSLKTILLLSNEPVSQPAASTLPVLDAKVLLAPPKNLEPVIAEVNPKEDVVILPYSSGTTGLSKGVMLTHENLVANVLQTDDVLEAKEDDTIVGVLPFYHIYGITVIMFRALYHGSRVLTMPKFDFVEFLGLVQKEKITVAPIVPPIILALAKHPVVEKFDISSIRCIVSGAAPLSAELQKLAASRLKGCVVKQGYGMTESAPVLTVQEDKNAHEFLGSAGVLVANCELKVVDPSTNEEREKPYEEGELCFRGPNVMKGYLGNEEATASTIKDGWLHTGDIGYIDATGNIFIVDRLKELIKFKGYQVPPAELEGILLRHESIADTAVIGVPDEEAGELPKAYVVVKPGATLTAEEVMAFVEGKVAPQKKIRLVEFIAQIPKSASGKILRRELKQLEKEKLMEKP